MAAKNSKEVTSFLLDMVSTLEARGNAGSLIESYLKAVKSWLSFNDIVVTKKIRIPYSPNRYEKTPRPRGFSSINTTTMRFFERKARIPRIISALETFSFRWISANRKDFSAKAASTSCAILVPCPRKLLNM